MPTSSASLIPKLTHLAAVLFVAHGWKEPDPHPDDTKIDRYPFTVMVVKPFDPSKIFREHYLTAGTALNLNWVLTQWTTIEDYGNGSFWVVGKFLHSIPKDLKGVVKNPVDRVIPHPNATVEDRNSHFNVALLHTKYNMRRPDAYWSLKRRPPIEKRNDEVRHIEVVYWVEEEPNLVKYVQNFYVKMEGEGFCERYTSEYDLCLSTTPVKKDTGRANRRAKMPCFPADGTIALGAPIMIDNEFHGVFLGLEMKQNSKKRCLECNGEKTCDVQYHVGVRNNLLQSWYHDELNKFEERKYDIPVSTAKPPSTIEDENATMKSTTSTEESTMKSKSPTKGSGIGSTKLSESWMVRHKKTKNKTSYRRGFCELNSEERFTVGKTVMVGLMVTGVVVFGEFFF